GERRQHERRYDGYVVELPREDRVDEPRQGKDDRRKQHHRERDQRMLHFETGEAERYHRHHGTDQQTTDYAAGDVTQDNGGVRHRGDHHFLDVTGKLGAEKRRDNVAVGVRNHRHHDQSRGDVLHVVIAVHAADAPADQAAEDDEVKRHGDRGRDDGLQPDADDANEFLGDQRLERHPVQPEVQLKAP